MDLDDMVRHARQSFSKLQTETFRLTHEEMIDLLTVIERIATELPEYPDCDNLSQRVFSRLIIDGYMDDINRILSNTKDENAPYIVYVALNFTWKKHMRHFSVGEMRIWMVHSEYDVLQQNPQSLRIFRCVATRDKLRMDDILPEKGVVLVRQYAVSRPVRTPDLPKIYETVRKLFADGNTKNLNKLVSFFGTKQSDTLIYFNVAIFGKKDEDGDSWVIKLHASRESQSHHYAIRVPVERPALVRQIEEKMCRPADDPVRKLRSYAARKNLPFYERTHHVPEQVLLFFYAALRSARWNDVGATLYEAQQQWEEFPPYAGVFPIRFGLCLEGSTFHMAAHAPSNKLSVETFIEAHDDELEARTREFFPDAKYANAVRRYALNPNLPVRTEDAFLEPYIRSHRSSVIAQNVRAPTNRSLPTHLAGEIEKWRQYYRQKLRQHVSKHPRDVERLGQLHPSYAEEVRNAARHAQLQKSVRQFVYTNPTQQVPGDHPFRQQIQQGRRRVRQQSAAYDTPDDLAQAIRTDLNLIDPITSMPIRDPVRSPYVPSGVYEKQSLSSWLSKGGLRLDPLSRKEMPTSFRPQTDEPLKKFIQTLDSQIQAITQDKQGDDDAKKARLLGLKQQLVKKKVFQNIISKKKT